MATPSIWYPLYPTLVSVFRIDTRIVNGTQVNSWAKVNAILDPVHEIPGEMKCFMDLLFLRAFKDTPPAQEAGSAIPLRTGVMFVDDTHNKLKPGDRLVCKYGPVDGTFQIKHVPDRLPNVLTGLISHIEVQVFEVAGSQRELYPEPKAVDV